jgi:hypothetical protein
MGARCRVVGIDYILSVEGEDRSGNSVRLESCQWLTRRRTPIDVGGSQ